MLKINEVLPYFSGRPNISFVKKSDTASNRLGNFQNHKTCKKFKTISVILKSWYFSTVLKIDLQKWFWDLCKFCGSKNFQSDSMQYFDNFFRNSEKPTFRSYTTIFCDFRKEVLLWFDARRILPLWLLQMQTRLWC